MTTVERRFPEQQPDALFVPEMATIGRAENLTAQDRLFEIELPGGKDLGHKPGQFVEVSIYGFGEAPISVSSSPARRGSFELCVRKLGGLTGKLYTLGAGDSVGIRGPFGNGFAMEDFEGADCLIVAGGIGMAPLRSVVNTILADRDRYGRLILLYGNRTPDDILFADELEAWGEDDRNQVLVTIDRPAEGWDGHVGVVTMRIPEDHIYFSLERRMKCGVGKCGHCQVEGKYVCIDGPVFTGEALREFHESI
jgi:NAD(P)H-flavin reductase